MKTSAITIHNLSVILGHDVEALHDLSLELTGGQIIGFIGPSGAGKTTLLRTIVGRQRLVNGSATVFGMPVGSKGLRSQLSYMTQQPSVYPDLTVTENVSYFAAMQGLKAAAVTEALDQVNLTEYAKRIVSDLSGGQRQRVSLAISLLGEPKLIVLDEPTVGLDPTLRVQLWKLFRSLADNGATVLVSSHVMDEAERCDDLVLIRDGRLLAHATPAKLKSDTKTNSIEAAFLKLVGKA